MKPCAWPFPVTAYHFSEEAGLTTLARDAALWDGYCATLAGGGGDTQQQQQVLYLLWKAAACFAERASWDDKTQRQLWSALTAADLQVSAAPCLFEQGEGLTPCPRTLGGADLQNCPPLQWCCCVSPSMGLQRELVKKETSLMSVCV